MNFLRHWIVIPMLGVAVLFLGFGCTTKSEPPKPAPPAATNQPLPQPVQPPTNVVPSVATTAPVYVPDMSHSGEPLPDGILAWDNLTKSTDAAADQAEAHFTFNLTNVSNDKVAIMNVHPSCGCTTAQLPPMPWVLEPGANGQIKLTVNLAGKSGTLVQNRQHHHGQGQQDPYVADQNFAARGSDSYRRRPDARSGDGQGGPAGGFQE